MKISLINPNLIVQKNDPLTTGVVYMPFGLAAAAASLREAGYAIEVIDAYGEHPGQARANDKFWVFGLTEEEVTRRVSSNTEAVFLYAINLTNHNACTHLVAAIRQKYPSIKIGILENTQAVTAYALKQVADEFYAAGADLIITGEADLRIKAVVESIVARNEDYQNIDGVGTPQSYTPPTGFIQNLDLLPFPAWDLFPLENYWRLKFAHGPFTSDKYLPLLTSRGCPYACKFCVVPATNNQRWRARSAKNVVDEIAFWVDKYDVHEFHIEDLDPTISDERIQQICNEILKRKLKVTWKLASGTKVETIRSEETVRLMAQAGCTYVSISPETGSKKLLKAINKPFNLEHAIQTVHYFNKYGIYSQACFVLGYPGETAQDRSLTWKLVRQLTKNGISEIAQFIISPVPGSAIYDQFEGYNSLSELNFTPTWREDYAQLVKFRFRLYFMFLLWKLWYHPLKIAAQPYRFLSRKFQTKMEMVPFRALRLKWMGKGAKSMRFCSNKINEKDKKYMVNSK